MALNASKMDRFEELVQHQLTTIAARLEELGRRLEEERSFAPQKPEEVPGYAELKTALHNLIEHLELAEGRTAEAIGALRERLEEVSQRTTQALKLAEAGGGPVDAVQTLEERINALHRRLEDIAEATESGTRAYVDACMKELTAKVEQAAAPAMPQDVEEMIRHETGQQVRAAEERIAAMVARLQGKMEDLAAGAMDVERLRTDIDNIGDQLNRVRTELGQKAGKEELAQVRASLEQLSATVDGKADRADVVALKERLDALAAQLEVAHASAAPADDSRVNAIEEQVMALRQMVEEALGEPLAIIGDKLAAHDAALNELSAHGQRLQQMESIIDQLQRTLEGDAAGQGAGADMAEVAALKEGLKELEQFTREADRNAREMLEATQATLAEIVERLIALEEDGARRAGDPATPSAPAHRQEDSTRMDAVADLLGESAPAMGGASTAAEAHARDVAASTPVDTDDPHDIARRIAARLEHGEADTTPAATRDTDSAGQADKSVRLEDDFIAAARRAALAANQRHGSIEEEDGKAGGFLARLRGGRGKERRRAPATASGVETAPPNAMNTPDGKDASREDGKPGAVLGLLSGLRGKLGRAAASSAPAPASAGQAADGGEVATAQTRKRLLLAGTVLLAAVSFYLSQNPSSTPAPTVEATPASSRATPATTGNENEAGTPGDEVRIQREAPAAKVPGKNTPAPHSGTPARDRHSRLFGAPARSAAGGDMGMFTPSRTASATTPSTRAGGIITGSIPGASRAPSVKASTAATLPEDIGPPALREAALNGNGKAAYVVAVRYLRGQGKIAPDAKKAAEWFRRAADKGVIVAMFHLGALHEQGLGVAQDLDLASKWYERAAMMGNVRAMHNLGALYAAGKLGAPDYDKAAYWFRKAAEHGLRDSQFNLAVLHHRGQGVPQDLGEAWFWYSVAAARGDSMAATQARKLATYLGEAKLASLKARLRDYRLKPAVRNANMVIIDRPEWREEGGAQAAATSNQPQPKGKALVMEVQQLLKRIGYDVGPVDGVMGNRTANAIRLFQLQSRMKVNGQPDGELLRRLRAAAASRV